MTANVRKFNRDGTNAIVTVKVGDVVGFKSDYEQHGRITKIEPKPYSDEVYLTLHNENGFGGEYLRYAKTTREFASDCWI